MNIIFLILSLFIHSSLFSADSTFRSNFLLTANVDDQRQRCIERYREELQYLRNRAAPIYENHESILKHLERTEKLLVADDVNITQVARSYKALLRELA